ncbi:hypothetical protein ABZ721_30595 [Streptomyces sp. NPDC006733]|uniref:hypothetical protein n=1 Tax=Streptomyces sp. NPDC006733 TaxID=3155460 RepID=UPI0033F195D8
MTEIYDVASVHGRFQPVHLGHVEYLLAAKERCRFLYVGVAQFVRSRLQVVSSNAPHRVEPTSNPMTFFERQAMIREVLLDCGVPSEEFAVVPFPIEDLAVLPEFLPRTLPILTTIYEEWNREKVALLRAAGYPVEVLYQDRARVYSGTEVRRLVAAGDARYESMVPPATARWVLRVGMRQRLLEGAREDPAAGSVDDADLPGTVGDAPDHAG